MRLTISSAAGRVEIRVKGRSPAAIRQAERTARRLLDRLPTAPADDEEQAEQPFGFALGCQIEQCGPAPLREHDADPTLQGGTP